MFRDRLDYPMYHSLKTHAKEQANNLKFVIKDDKYKIDCELRKDEIVFNVDTDNACYVGKFSNDSLPQQLKLLFQDVSELYQILLDDMHDILKYENGEICIKNKMSKKEKWFNLPLQKVNKTQMQIYQEKMQKLAQENAQLKRDNESIVKENNSIVKENESLKAYVNRVSAKAMEQTNKLAKIIEEKDKEKAKLIEELQSLKLAVHQLVQEQEENRKNQRRTARGDRPQTHKREEGERRPQRGDRDNRDRDRDRNRDRDYQRRPREEERRPETKPVQSNNRPKEREANHQQKINRIEREQRQKKREQIINPINADKIQNKIQKPRDGPTIVLSLSALNIKFNNSAFFQVNGTKITKTVAIESKYGNCQMLLSPALPKNERVMLVFTIINNPQSCHSFGITSRNNINKVYSANNIDSMGITFLPYLTFVGWKPMTKMNKAWRLQEGMKVSIIIDPKENEITFKAGNACYTRSLPQWYKEKEEEFLPFLQLTDVGTSVQLN